MESTKCGDAGSDMVNHIILVDKFIRSVVRSSIVPWLCDFVINRVQCVRYNQTLLEYKVFNGALPQGTKLGPIGFQVIINHMMPCKTGRLPSVVGSTLITLAENRSFRKESKLQNTLDEFSD